MVSINVKDSRAVEYPGSDGRTLKFYTNFTFLVNHTYYVLMDPGAFWLTMWKLNGFFCTICLAECAEAEVGGAGWRPFPHVTL